jgi:hypothetical protein
MSYLFISPLITMGVVVGRDLPRAKSHLIKITALGGWRGPAKELPSSTDCMPVSCPRFDCQAKEEEDGDGKYGG